MTREEAIAVLEAIRQYIVAHYLFTLTEEDNEAIDMAISALSAEPIERISDSTIKVEYKGYEDIGRIILTDEDIFCKIFYEDTKQKYEDDDNYDALIPDKYMTEPSDLISRAEAVKEATNYKCGECGYEPVFQHIEELHYCPNCGARMENEK